MLAVSVSELDEFAPGLEVSVPLFEQSHLNQLVTAILTFSRESSKPPGSITVAKDSPIFVALQSLGGQYQKTTSSLLSIAESIRVTSQANASTILQRGNALPALIKGVIGALQAFSKAKDEASVRALGGAILNFLDPSLSLLFLFEKCGLSDVIKGQKDLFEKLNRLVEVLPTVASADSEDFKGLIQAIATSATLLTFAIRRKALTLPPDAGTQHSLFDSCVNIESTIYNLITEANSHAASPASEREISGIRQQARSIFTEFHQILSSLSHSYSDQCFKYHPNLPSLFGQSKTTAEAVLARFQSCSKEELVPFLSFLSPIPACLEALAANPSDPTVVVQTTALLAQLAQQTLDEITLMIKDVADKDKGLYRHFSLLMDGLRFHALNIQGSVAAHLARLIAGDDGSRSPDTVRSDMLLPYAIKYFFDYYSELACTLVVIFSFEEPA